MSHQAKKQPNDPIKQVKSAFFHCGIRINTKIQASPWHLVLPAVCDKGLLSVSLSLSVLRCGGYVQSSASWFVQLLACSLSLPSYNDTPLPLVQPPPPPVSVDGATPWQGITHNLDRHTTLSQGWRTRPTSPLSPSQKIGLGLKICIKLYIHSCHGPKNHCFYLLTVYVQT